MIDAGIESRIALVTGTDSRSGIGAAVARALADQGAAIVATYVEREPVELIREIRERGGNAAAVAADLRNPAAMSTIFDAAERLVGPVEILINNAAASTEDSFLPHVEGSTDWAGRPLTGITSETHDLHFAVNSRAPALMMAEFARRHAARGARWGRIVNLSTGGAHCFPGEVSYGASKLALEGYSRSAAVELAPLGITVNIVSPGPTQTGWIPENLVSDVARSIPMGRVGTPEDIADSIVFFCSQGARWLTGQTLQAGGGHRM